MRLASAFSSHVSALTADQPLTSEQMRHVAPSIFAHDKHQSRSDRYAYIPTIDILAGFHKEGFAPFMVCQTRTRKEGKRLHTKHMIRLRHARDINKDEANEIILLNSHDGTSAYQTLSGIFRFVCQNGLVCGEQHHDIRIAHKGNVIDNVIDGAFRVLDEFMEIDAQKDAMKSLSLSAPEQLAFARAALHMKYGDPANIDAPITADQLLGIQREDDRSNDLWTTLNRIQEHVIKGGLRGKSVNGARTTTRPVMGIDSSIRLNRALWQLAQEMQALKQ